MHRGPIPSRVLFNVNNKSLSRLDNGSCGLAECISGIVKPPSCTAYNPGWSSGIGINWFFFFCCCLFLFLFLFRWFFVRLRVIWIRRGLTTAAEILAAAAPSTLVVLSPSTLTAEMSAPVSKGEGHVFIIVGLDIQHIIHLPCTRMWAQFLEISIRFFFRVPSWTTK